MEGQETLSQSAQADLSGRYTGAGFERLSEFETGPWGDKFTSIGKSWRNNWEHITPFFAFSKPVRKLIYTTNSIESLNSGVRKAIRNKGHFPNDEAATKLIWLALRKLSAKWKNPPIAWAEAKSQFAIQFEDRFTIND